MDNKNKVGKFLRDYRKRNDDMSLRKFAEIVGVSFSHLSKIERGEHNPSKATLDIIANATGLNKDELYIMAGYAPEKEWGEGLDALFPTLDESESEKLAVMKKIAKEFPDADLMFHDLASMTADDLEEVYEFIKFKSQQKK